MLKRGLRANAQRKSRKETCEQDLRTNTREQTLGRRPLFRVVCNNTTCNLIISVYADSNTTCNLILSVYADSML